MQCTLLHYTHHTEHTTVVFRIMIRLYGTWNCAEHTTVVFRIILVMRNLPTVCTNNGKEGIKNLGRHGKRLTLCTQTFAVTAECILAMTLSGTTMKSVANTAVLWVMLVQPCVLHHFCPSSIISALCIAHVSRSKSPVVFGTISLLHNSQVKKETLPFLFTQLQHFTTSNARWLREWT